MGYGDYTILFPQFIVCDSTNYMSPLIYTMSADSMKLAEEGFSHKGKDYPGVYSIIDSLDWAVENDVWNISRDNYINNGVVNL